MGERVVHRVGNALTDDLGRERYDLIFVAHLVHHFDVGQNETLVSRAAAALKPGGTLAILDVLRATRRSRQPDRRAPRSLLRRHQQFRDVV